MKEDKVFHNKSFVLQGFTCSECFQFENHRKCLFVSRVVDRSCSGQVTVETSTLIWFGVSGQRLADSFCGNADRPDSRCRCASKAPT